MFDVVFGTDPIEGVGTGWLTLTGGTEAVGKFLAVVSQYFRLVPVDNSLIFINFMNRLRAKRTDSLTNRFFLLSIRPV